MGIKDQFQDKAQELQERAKKAMGNPKDEASERARQEREGSQEAKERGQQELRERTGRDEA